MSVCPECGEDFEPKRSDQAFCSASCNKSFQNRALARARRVYQALYHFRLEHAVFGANWRFITREVASWIRDDRAAGRGPPPPHNHDADRGHERAAS